MKKLLKKKHNEKKSKKRKRNKYKCEKNYIITTFLPLN